jgi:hypothetical protein
MADLQNLKQKLKAYKQKYYMNMLIKGSIFLLLYGLLSFLFAAGLEYFFRLSSNGRLLLLIGFSGVFLYTFIRYVIRPVWSLLYLHKHLSDEEAARQIGNYFPEVKDKLLNILQLAGSGTAPSQSLIAASIEQKTKEISLVPFSQAIDFRINWKYARLLLIPIGLLLLVFMIVPSFVTESTTRIINYSKTYVPEAPFSFIVENEKLETFRNEDFSLRIRLEGEAIPQYAYLLVNERRIKMRENGDGHFEHTFTKIQDSFEFRFEAAGFASGLYTMEVLRRPMLNQLDITLNYPKYLGLESETLSNSGNLQVPEGTEVFWELQTRDAGQLNFRFESEEETIKATAKAKDQYELRRVLKASDRYRIDLENSNATNAKPIEYRIEVVKDQYPEINVKQFVDTTLYAFIVFGGSIRDDHGLRELSLHVKKDNQDQFEKLTIPINRESKEQNIYFQYDTDSLGLMQGSKVEYFLEVKDNDGINGSKSTRSPVYLLAIPDASETREIMERTASNTQKEMNDASERAKEVKEQVEEIERKIKGKKSLDWQDLKMIEDLFDKRTKLDQQIENMQRQAEETEQLMERFNPENEKLREKMKRIQELMDELLDEETKALYEELQRLLEENKDINQIQRMMEELSRKENSMEKELDRTLELFNRLKYEMKAEENLARMEELEKQMEELTEDYKDQSIDNEQLKESQEALNEEFEALREEMEEMRKLNEELDNPDRLDETQQQEEEISQDLDDASEEIKGGERNKAGQKQQGATEKLKNMRKTMESMMESAEMEMINENIASLQAVLHNLVTLSKDQEELIKNFREVNTSDPRYIDLSKKQLDLKNNSKILQDSLKALSTRVFQLSSFINRELEELNGHFDEALDQLKNRRKSPAVGRQEFAMTSINNLGLMLDDLLDQLMNPPTGSGGKGGKSGNQKSLSELQKRLSEQIEEIKKGGMKGRELSEELMRMAAEQEQLRRAMQEMQEQTMDGELSREIQEIMEQMEQNETDLVNKNLSDVLIERQNDLNTRLLDAENAMREQETEEEREGEQAKEREKTQPKIFEEYLKAKEKEVEFLRTIPPKLNSYYRMEVNEYFKRLNKDLN